MTSQLITHEDIERSLAARLQLFLAVADDSSVGIQSDAKAILNCQVHELINGSKQDTWSDTLSGNLKEFLSLDPQQLKDNIASYVVELHEKLSEATSRVADKKDVIIRQIDTSRKLEALSSSVSESPQTVSSARKKSPKIVIEVENDQGNVEVHNWSGLGRRPRILYSIMRDKKPSESAIKSLRDSVEKEGSSSGELDDGSHYTMSVVEDNSLPA